MVINTCLSQGFFEDNPVIVKILLMEEDKKKKINDIKDTIKSLKTDLKELQNNCTHSEDTIKFHAKTNSVRKICNICQKIIGYPTEDELRENDFL